MTLRDYREQMGISQKELAKMAGTSKRTIQALENGERSILNAKLITLLPIAKVLGVQVEELVGFIFEYNDKFIVESDFKWFK